MSKLRNLVLLLVVVVLVMCVAVTVVMCAELKTKKLQGDPSEFSEHVLPEPIEAHIESRHSLWSIQFDKDSVYTSKVPVDSRDLVRLTLIHPSKTLLEALRVQVIPPPAAPAATSTAPAADASAVNRKNHPDNVFGAKKSHFSFQYDTEDQSVQTSFFGWTQHRSAPAMTWSLENPIQGDYVLKISVDEALQSTIDGDLIDLHVIMENHGPYMTYSHLGSYKTLHVGQEVSLLTQLKNEEEHQTMLVEKYGLDPSAVQVDPETGRKHFNTAAKIDKIRPLAASHAQFKSYLGLNDADSLMIESDVDLVTPDGEQHVLPMRDDGVHYDLAANDGVFGAKFVPKKAGTYTARIEMRGYTSKGMVFYRTTDHVFTIVDNVLKLDAGRASLSLQEHPENDEMIKINLHLSNGTDKGVVGKSFRAYAEVWAESADDEEKLVPVAWIGGITRVESISDSALALPLEMSMRWLARANARLPLTLRNVYVQDVDSSVPLVEAAEIPVALHRLHEQNRGVYHVHARSIVQKMIAAKHRFSAKNDTVTETMKFGVRPVELRREAVLKNRNASNAQHKMLVIHGYCAGDNPFSEDSFTNYAMFEDLEKNRSNDAFAKLIADFGSQFSSFSIVSHSQGGMAALHLYTFYWSHMDNSDAAFKGTANNDARIMQSVGTPYEGSGLAGGIASIGDKIGIGCGKNTDLTHDGAKLWLSSIPKSTRQHMFYYTTQYKPLSSCVLAAQIVLKWPNDGTTEQKYSQLAGGNFVNHTERQCHTDDMKYPPQCRDSARNKEINQKTAR